jgi:hypothetical protein
MPRLQILDLLKAVSAVAPAHREVAVWWYLPPGSGNTADRTFESGAVAAEVVVEPAGDVRPDLEVIRSRLVGQLGGRPVIVRSHGGEAERFHLYRLLTRRA